MAAEVLGKDRVDEAFALLREQVKRAPTRTSARADLAAALKDGAVDAVVAPEALRDAALAMLKEAIEGRLDWKARRDEKLAPVKLNAMESMMAFTSAMGFVAGKAGPNYPAPMLAIRSIQESSTKGRDDAIAIEAKYFAKAAATPQANALVGLFMADQAVNISQRAIELNEEPQLKPYIDIPIMSQLSQKMLRDSLDAFVRKDVGLARQVIETDNKVDALKNQVFRELLTFMMEDPRTIPRAIGLILVSRHLERVADHATNIAEMVVFLVEGRNIRHASQPGT